MYGPVVRVDLRLRSVFVSSRFRVIARAFHIRVFIVHCLRRWGLDVITGLTVDEALS